MDRAAHTWFYTIFFCATLCVASSAKLVAADLPVEPLLQKYCLGCHNQQEPEAGLSLQTFEAIKTGGDNGEVLNRANPKAGLLFQVLDPAAENTMPPADEQQPTKAERNRLRQWVLSGAAIQSMAAGIPDVPSTHSSRDHHTQAFSGTSISKTELAIGGSRRIEIRNIDSGKRVREFEIADGNVTSLQWAKNRRQLLAAAGLPGINGFAVLLSAKDGSIFQRFEGHTDAVYSAVISPNEKLVATAGYDRRILIHDVETGNILQTLKGHNGSIFQLAFDNSNQVLCSASTDGTVKVWNVKTAERLDTLSQPQGEQYTVQVSGKLQQIFAAGQDSRIRVWELVSRQSAAINPLLTSTFAHEQTIHRMQLSPDESKLATAAEDGTIRIWSTQPFSQIQSLPRQTSMVTSLAFASNDRLIVTTLAGTSTSYAVAAAKADPKRSDSALPEVSGMSSVVANPQSAHTPPVAAKETDGENNSAKTAQLISVPFTVTGQIHDPASETDADCYSFDAVAGQKLVIEINAARKKSPLDSHVQILTESGQPILRTRLQAVRDSWFTFRGKNGEQTNDFRLFNWREMELNQFLYADGEVTKLHHYPRGPDSGFNVYPGFGNRHTYFGTTASSHALLAPAFIVEPVAPDETIVANGLPVFPVYYENDDDGLREFGADSRLFFTPSESGRYVVRVTDARDFSGEDYVYELTVRATAPSFKVTKNQPKISIAKGTGTEIEFKVNRIDQFLGPITIDAEGIPEGYICSTPVTVQRNQYRAYATLFATEDAADVTEDQLKQIRFVASSSESQSPDQKIDIGGIQELTLQPTAKLKITMHKTAPGQQGSHEKPESNAEAPSPIVLSVHPGETIKAHLTLDRIAHTGVVSFGKEDAGRNLPHGVFVDNIGLNGLLLLEDQSEREFFITAAPTAEPGTYSFYLKSNVGNATSYPGTLIVKPSPDDQDEYKNAAR